MRERGGEGGRECTILNPCPCYFLIIDELLSSKHCCAAMHLSPYYSSSSFSSSSPPPSTSSVGQEDLERLLEENERLRQENEGMKYQLEHPKKQAGRKSSNGGTSRGGNREKEGQQPQQPQSLSQSQQQQQQQQYHQLYGGNNNGTGNGYGEYNDGLVRQGLGQGLGPGPGPGQGLGPGSLNNILTSQKGVSGSISGSGSLSVPGGGIARGVSFHASPGQVLGKYKAPPDIKVGDPPCPLAFQLGSSINQLLSHYQCTITIHIYLTILIIHTNPPYQTISPTHSLYHHMNHPPGAWIRRSGGQQQQ